MYIGLKPGLLHKVFTRALTIKEGNTGTILPCSVLSLEIQNENQIPTEPVDSNLLVSDTIIKKPRTFSLELHVYEEDSKDFFKILSDIQTGDNGFTIIDRMGFTYDNLYYTNLSYTTTGDKQGAFDCHLELREVIKVTAIKSIKGRPITPPPGTPVNKGTAIAKPEVPSNEGYRSIIQSIRQGKTPTIVEKGLDLAGLPRSALPF